MPLRNLFSKRLKLVMVGGKGGVGKTTCASAIALECALRGKKTLIVSSDPTPSLSDIFETEIGEEERRVREGLELFGMEISSDLILRRWKERFGPEIYEVISSFADLEYDFVDYIGTAPGIEEEYMLNLIVELTDSGAYDVVVWDTAPAGHTLRLLELPHLFLRHLEAATKFYMSLYGYFEKMKEMVRSRRSKRTLLEIIGGWERMAQRIVESIKDGERTKYVVVTIPEALGVRLTERFVRELQGHGLYVENLIVNQVIEEEDCEFHRQRKAMQQRYIDLLRETYPHMNVILLPLSPQEVKGFEAIGRVSRLLFSDA
jgi:arsenite-transporting ATPase